MAATMKPLLICALILSVCINLATAVSYRLTAKKLRFQKCPGFKSDLINIKKSQFNYNRTSGPPENQLRDFRFTGPDGKSRTLPFPGCFNLDATAHFGATVHNPYVEVTLNFNGMDLCDGKYYKPNKYCKATQNKRFLSGSKTKRRSSCRFCDLCIEARRHAGSAYRKAEQMVGKGQVQRACDLADSGIRAGQRFPVRLRNICVPSGKELETQLDKVIPNWRKLREQVKRGSILVTLHVLDRPNPIADQCLASKGNQQCDRQLKNPELGRKDRYIACYYGNIDYNLDWS